MENILSFSEVSKIAGLNIKMDTPKEKFTNVHIKDGKTIHFKSCVEGLLYTNIDEQIMITNTTNVYVNPY